MTHGAEVSRFQIILICILPRFHIVLVTETKLNVKCSVYVPVLTVNEYVNRMTN